MAETKQRDSNSLVQAADRDLDKIAAYRPTQDAASISHTIAYSGKMVAFGLLRVAEALEKIADAMEAKSRG